MDYINRHKDNNYNTQEVNLIINSIIDSIPDALLITGQNNTISFFNSTFIQFWQIPSNDFQIYDRDLLFNYLDSKTLEKGYFVKTMEYLNNSLQEATFDELELMNGNFIECYTIPRYINNEITGRIWSFRDISQQKRSKNMLQMQKQELINAHQIASLGSWTYDIRSKEFTYSDSLAHICEGLLAHKTFRAFIKVVYPDDLETVQNFFKKIETDEVIDNYDLRYRVIGTRIYYLKTLVEVIYSNGKPKLLLGTTQDITEQALLEISLASAKEAAEDYNLAKGIFLSNVSHEMRTPLNAILGYSDILLQMLGDTLQRDYVNSIKSSGEALLSLIEDILYITEVNEQKVKINNDKVNIRNLFQEIYALFRFQFEEKGLHFTLDIDKVVPDYITIDRSRLKQILVNLVSNALKFTESGYVLIFVNASNLHDTEYSDMSIYIEDTGIGIDEKNKDKIFESFRQAEDQDKRNFDGAGLGLYITKKNVELLGGTIEVQSALNVGSVFIVSLKNLKIPGEGVKIIEDEMIDTENIDFEQASILIADDRAFNRRIFKGLLSRFNFTIFEADNAGDAIKLAEKYKPSIIIMDLMMSEMDGYNALKIIRENSISGDIPIIAFSMSDKGINREILLKKGFNGFLEKPVSYSTTVKLLSKFIPYTSKSVHPNIENEYTFSNQIENLLLNNDIIISLGNRLLQNWKDLSTNGSSKKQKEFAEKLEQFGIDYDYGFLTDLSRSLSQALSVYDIDKASEIMNKISLLFDKVHNHINSLDR